MEQLVDVLSCVSGLSNLELIAGLKRLVRHDRALSAKLLVHLGEVDARGLYREQAYSSMFEYAVSALRMSEAEAYLRIHAARLGRRFPRIVELLGEGAVHLTALKLLGPHLTPENHERLLERARGKRKWEIEQLVAEIAPQPDVPTQMRKLPTRAPRSGSKAAAAEVTHATAVAGPDAKPMQAAPAMEKRWAAPAGPDAKPMQAGPATSSKTGVQVDAAHVAPGGSIDASPTAVAECAPAAKPTFCLQPSSFQNASTPLRPGRFKLQVSIDQQAHDQLQQLRDLLRHQIPNGDLARILELAVQALHEKTTRQRFAKTGKPRVSKRKSRSHARRSRYIPRAVVREVHARDEARCTFVSEDGRRCSERGFLELHHRAPFARGGASTPDNLRLMCRAHNALLAERDYGADFMRKATRLSSGSAKRSFMQHEHGVDAAAVEHELIHEANTRTKPGTPSDLPGASRLSPTQSDQRFRPFDQPRIRG